MNFITSKLSLKNIQIDDNELLFDYQIDQHSFRTEIYYEDVHFPTLKNQYGEEYVNRLVFQIGFLEGMKYCSLIPEYYDVSNYSQHINTDLLDLFSVLFNHIFAQHKVENGFLDYQGPQILANLQDTLSTPSIINPKKEILFSCGGGKDSLVSMKLLERGNIPYGVSQYSHSVYGKFETQQELINNLVEVCTPLAQHRMYVIDDFLDSPVLEEHFKNKIRTLCAPETPTAIFEMLPIMLAHGYTQLCVGHERSANSANTVVNGEEINHQWGKSFLAEKVLNFYIKKHLINNIQYYSILQPIYDFLIFQLLKKDQDLINHTQSCNVEKPWCKRCPKCAYVWLCMLAYLDTDKVNAIFQENPFDIPELEKTFLQIIGIADHRPYECIGEIGESQLALYVCYKKGLTGKVIDIFKEKVLPTMNLEELLAKYNTVYASDNLIPSEVRSVIWPQFEKVRAETLSC